ARRPTPSIKPVNMDVSASTKQERKRLQARGRRKAASPDAPCACVFFHPDCGKASRGGRRTPPAGGPRASAPSDIFRTVGPGVRPGLLTFRAVLPPCRKRSRARAAAAAPTAGGEFRPALKTLVARAL